MKLIAFVLLLVLVQLSVINAQGRMNPKERAADLKTKLELTDEQSQKIEAIFVETQQKSKEIRDSTSGNREEMMKAIKPLNEAADKKIDSILTDKQKEQYAKIKKERQERMEKRMKSQN